MQRIFGAHAAAGRLASVVPASPTNTISESKSSTNTEKVLTTSLDGLGANTGLGTFGSDEERDWGDRRQGQPDQWW